MLKDAVRLKTEQLFSVLSTIRRFGLLIDQIEFFSSSGGKKEQPQTQLASGLSLFFPQTLYIERAAFFLTDWPKWVLSVSQERERK